MGSARARGSYEERKMQAMKAKRYKREPADHVLGRTVPGLAPLPTLLGLLLSIGKKKPKTQAAAKRQDAELANRL